MSYGTKDPEQGKINHELSRVFPDMDRRITLLLARRIYVSVSAYFRSKIIRLSISGKTDHTHSRAGSISIQ